MRKEIAIHTFSLVAYFLFISFIKNYINVGGLIFLLGGVIGTILPDLDHLIYVYFLSPQDLTSQRANYTLSKREMWKAAQLLYDTRRERTELIFHTAYFQVVALILTVFVLTSSSGLLGRGVVLGLSLHLLIDQLVDFLDTGNISSWFKGNFLFSEGNMNRNRAIVYWSIIFLATTILSLVY